ncbi:f-box only protein 28 [Caerostris extrusa]|uniref:F-box only protein 28 n=1 Tax=Caerostris extrusa TaxID=172846 RepID=A0AAV4T0H3_CAEEX|nr:f-box only protein 28 [Caerostris extrusa]
MAMEHFDEKISPAFRKRKDAGPKIVTGINIYQPSISHHPKTSRHNGCEHKPHKWKEEVKNIAQKLSMSRREIQSLKSKVLDGNKSTTELEKKFLEMHSMFTSQLEKFKETDLKIDALTRLVESRIPVTPLLVASKETQTIPLEDDTVRNNTSDKAESEPKKQKPRYQLKGRPAKRLRKN